MITSEIKINLCPTCKENLAPSEGFECADCWANFLMSEDIDPIVWEDHFDEGTPVDSVLVRGYDEDDYTGRDVDG